MTEIPPRLSDQQQFILAYIATRDSRGFRTTPTGVSRQLAAEFDDDGDRIGQRLRRSTRHRLTNSHSSSFSRSVDRLEERELVDGVGGSYPRKTPYSTFGHRQPDTLRLTDAGRDAADEILRRHRDGRYSLAFDTIDAEI